MVAAKLTTILADFAGWSTVACVRNVAFSDTKLLRLIWFLVFIAMIAMFVIQLVLIILKYLSYPAEIVTTMKFSSQPFPDVTFCSFNPFKLSEVEKNPAFSDIKRMLDEYTAAEQGTAGGSNLFGFQGLDRFSRQDRANDLLILLSANLTEAQKAPALYKVDELVTECLFAGTTCDPESIEAVPDPVYGRCFVYKGNNRTITRTGLAHGLRLILTANLADSITFVSDYLPTTSRVGVRMTVNEENSFVSLDQSGFNVGVGFQTSVALSKSRIERIVAPYGECVDTMSDAFNHYSDVPHTLDACYATCTQRKVVERCGCANPTHRKADNETWCGTPAHASCIASHRGDQHNSAQPNLNQLADCGCKPPCVETHFSTTISVLTYPAFGYTVGVGTTEQAENQKQEQQSKTTTSTSTTTTTSTTSTTTSTTTTTTPTTTSTTTTTEAPTTTRSCNYSPSKKEMIERVLGSGRFTMRNPESCDSRPTFECKPAFAMEWWKCWPCYYECWENRDRRRLPNSDLFPTPDVKCSDLFDDFAHIEMGYGELRANPTFGPSWEGWEEGGNPRNDKCAEAKNTMETAFITDCAIIEQYCRRTDVYTFDNNKILSKKVPTANWYDVWPCSYGCRNAPRFPANPTFSNVKCVDLFRCSVHINESSYSNLPSFDNWATGGSGSDDCAAMLIPGGSVPGGDLNVPTMRNKRSVNGTKEIPMPGKGSCESWNTNFKSVDDCKKWYKTNGMIVNVFYETLEYQVLAESASYSIPAAVNDLGGQAGLWLGLSVVSVVECLGLLFMIVVFCFTGKRMVAGVDRGRRVMPDYDNDDL